MANFHPLLSRQPRPHPKRAFTLIEILVCIAVIAILMGLIFPIIRRAREAAREVVCQSNLRQLLAAFRVFASDHDDQLPGGYWDLCYPSDSVHDHSDWLRGSATDWTSAPTGGTLYRYVQNTPLIYRCPSLEVNAPSPTALIGLRYGSNGHYDYVSMLDFTGARVPNIRPESQLTYPDSHVEYLPTPIIVEGDPRLINGFGMKSWHAGTDGMAHTHRGGAYYAAIDGSVKWLNEPPGGCAMWQSQAPSGRWVNFAPFPFYWGQWNRQ